MPDERLVDELARLIVLTEAAIDRIAEVESLRQRGGKHLGKATRDALWTLQARIERLAWELGQLHEKATDGAPQDEYAAPPIHRR
jgi:hypothetical protein